MVVSKLLQRRQEPWGWGADSETDIRSWQQPIESNHWSWSSHNCARSCWRNQHRPFYCHSAFEANWKGVKAWLVNASWADHKSKKLLFWSVVFSYFMQQQRIISWLVCDMWQKVDFIQLAKISSVVRPRCSKALSKVKLAPKKGHGHCLVICCLSDHYSFLNPHETIPFEKYAQQISEIPWKVQHLQPALVNRKGPILLHDSTWLQVTHFKSWIMNWAMKFCLILMFTWPLTNQLLLL